MLNEDKLKKVMAIMLKVDLSEINEDSSVENAVS